jgi:hypothetical protein
MRAKIAYSLAPQRTGRSRTLQPEPNTVPLSYSFLDGGLQPGPVLQALRRAGRQGVLGREK